MFCFEFLFKLLQMVHSIFAPQVYSLDLHCWRHLRGCQKCRISGFSSDLLYQNVHVTKMPQKFICTWMFNVTVLMQLRASLMGEAITLKRNMDIKVLETYETEAPNSQLKTCNLKLQLSTPHRLVKWQRDDSMLGGSGETGTLLGVGG